MYRGWMFKEAEYRQLQAALQESELTRSFQPGRCKCRLGRITSPTATGRSRDLTPPAVWTEGTNLATAWRVARTLGSALAYGSQGLREVRQAAVGQRLFHSAREPTVTPLRRSLRNLIAYQGKHLQAQAGLQAVHGTAQAHWRESLRLPALRGIPAVLLQADGSWRRPPYDREGGGESDFARYEEVAARFLSQFITIDVAKAESGEWVILEVGDGGVSMLPPRLTPANFYSALKAQPEE